MVALAFIRALVRLPYLRAKGRAPKILWP